MVSEEHQVIVDIGEIVDHHSFNFSFVLLILVKLLTITVGRNIKENIQPILIHQLDLNKTLMEYFIVGHIQNFCIFLSDNIHCQAKI
jgi:hypothetical protein